MAYPRYLKSLAKTSATRGCIEKAMRSYRPLLGIWLIDLALILGWHKPRALRRWPDIFCEGEFCKLTGLQLRDDEAFDEDGPVRKRLRITEAVCKNMLEQQRTRLQREKLPPDLPLFTNIALLAKLLGLVDADQAVLAFSAVLEIFPEFRSAISVRYEKTSNRTLCQLLARLTGLPLYDFSSTLAPGGALVSSGLISLNSRVVDLEDKLDLMKGLADVLLASHEDTDSLVGRFLHRAAPHTLKLDNFPHLSSDSAVLGEYLKNALTAKVTGVNILLYGIPGVGKTEYAQALAEGLGAELYEIAYSDEDGDPIRGEARLRAYSLCQRLLANKPNAVLMFDEVEDVFPVSFGILSALLGGDEDSGQAVGGKAWINRTLERNPVPAIWISNEVRQIDAAYKRRFDYSVKFPLPPKSVRLSIARHHVGTFNPTSACLERIVASDEMTPGQLERAAKVARIAASGDNARAMELVEQALDRSMVLLDQRRTSNRNVIRTGYDLTYLNVDADVSGIISGLKRRPRGTFCFYGAAGTGKSELARHIADQIDKPLIIRRASDILSMWVGEAEKNIAAMFSEAGQQETVLVLDEADSFLGDRRDAQQSWEVTQVNELLTQMEAFEGIFICTTNLMEKLDQASLRRFAFKVRFNPLTPDQRWSMFSQELKRLRWDGDTDSEWESRVRCLDRLTPGDFAVAARQFELWDVPATPDKLYEQLRKECQAKGAQLNRIGFGRGDQ